MTNEAPARRRLTFTVVELVAVAGIVAVLLAILVPIMNRMRESRGHVPCAGNLQRIGMALQIYAKGHDGRFPPTLEPLLDPKYLKADAFVCPSSDDTPAKRREELLSGGRLSYVYVGAGIATESIGYPSDVVVAYDRPQNHAPDGSYVLFADCHVDWLTAQQMQRILDEVAAGRLPVRLGAKWAATAPAPTTSSAR